MSTLEEKIEVMQAFQRGEPVSVRQIGDKIVEVKP
jgi:hypothetical protein